MSLKNNNRFFPVSPKKLSWYMCYLWKKGLSPATITSKMSAVAFWHQLFGYNDPVSSFEVKRTLMGMRKVVPPKQGRPPITIKHLNVMINTVSVCNWTGYIKRLFTAMLLLSFHAFLRPGEMTESVNTIKFDQVKFSSQSVKILFIKYKHSKGIPVKVKIRKREDPNCPVRALIRYVKVRGGKKDNLFCDHQGRPIPYLWYKQRFAEIVKVAHLNPGLKPHSARIGAATNAAAQGIPEDVIKRMGRWASSCYRNYIKLPILSL
ncbi:MAG: tyrosine-type recombinase/integrase [Bacteroidetes bacterium]|nr:tyrosine-type recombinase/integrase [Bacteroidota bacterium]